MLLGSEASVGLLRDAFPNGRWTGQRCVAVQHSGYEVLGEAVRNDHQGPGGVRTRVRLPIAVPTRIHLMTRRAAYVGSGLPQHRTGDPQFDKATRILGTPDFLVQAAFDADVRSLLMSSGSKLFTLDVEDGEVRIHAPLRSNTGSSVQGLVHAQVRIADLLVAAARGAGPQLQAAARELERADARRSRSSRITAAIVILFVLGILGGVGYGFVRSLP